jgi:hypothetical protein
MIECLMLQKVLSGLVYALLGIGDVEALLAHPIAGAS